MTQADEVGTNVVSLYYEMISPKLLQLMHEKGYYVWAWTINDIPRMKTLLEWGVDSVTSDRADVLIETVKKNKK